jgi:hypothetical protein
VFKHKTAAVTKQPTRDLEEENQLMTKSREPAQLLN